MASDLPSGDADAGTQRDLSGGPQVAKKRRRPVLLVVALVAIGLFVFVRALLPVHPKFGAIREAAAFDLIEARSNKLAVYLRTHLPDRIVQSPRFPTRWKEQPKYLNLQGAELEWSIGGTNSGWLYFWDVPGRPKDSRWEFAPCAESNFLRVAHVPSDFCGSGDPRCAELFGPSSSTNAINVSVGQILFARRTDQPERVYVLHLKEQDVYKLRVNYCAVDPP